MGEKNIASCIAKIAHHYPNAIALTEWTGFVWDKISYQDFIQKSHIFAEKLLALDVFLGERVILVARNRIDGVVALLGIWFVNATAVLIDPHLPEPILSKQIQTADARFIISENDQGDIEIKNNHTSGTQQKDCDQNIATLIFTSGTTGDYKAVVLRHDQYLYLTQFYNTLSEQTGCCLTVLPLFHVAGLFCGFLQPLLLGVRVVFFRSFGAEALQDALMRYQPNVFITVPRLLEVLDQKIALSVADHGKIATLLFSFSLFLSFVLHRYLHFNAGKIFFKKIHARFGGKLKKILCGSAPLAPFLQKRFLSFGFNLFCSYGLTETCGPITFTKYSHRWKENSVGPCIEKKDLCIAADGEILYRGFAMTSGYFRDEMSTQDRIRNGYFHTGDLGKLDRSGNVYIIGRIKELIIFSDGKKAMPEQIEAQYQNIAGVKEYAIFGVPYQGAVIAVVLADSYDIEQVSNNIFKRASTLRSPYRIADILVVSTIPRSSTLKIKRHELASQFLEYKKNNVNAHDLRNKTESIMEKIMICFQKILPDKKNVIHASITFAELGIDSLLAAQLSQAISEKLGVSLNPTVFWYAQSIQQLHDQLIAEKKMTTPAIQKRHYEKIAIVGMDCLFPGASDFDVFWKNLISGKDAITEIPASRFNIDDYYDAYALAPGKTNSRFGGFIEFPEKFDCEIFGLKPRVADAMDPEQKILLMQMKRLLEKFSSVDPFSVLRKIKTGFFLGAGFPDFMIQLIKTLPLEKVNPYSGIGMADFSSIGRVAYHFGLTGPAMLIKTACSSSLIAVHQAVRALQAHDCDMAIAGGVNSILVPEISICLTKGGFLSPDGRCRSFDAGANGYVRGEGSGLVLLKRYDDALFDHNKILAVITGSAINQDGASNGFAAPNGRAQMACYQEALNNAGISANQVQFIEAHGSGTQLGDAIEMQSIQAVYDQNRDDSLYVGAVKSMIGHCEAAAGIAGFIKAVGVLQNQIIPPNLHYQKPNPVISFENSRVILPTRTVALKELRFAAVSSFGVAGTNGHIVLECCC